MNKSNSIRRSLALAALAGAASLSQSALAANDIAALNWMTGIWQTSVTDGAQTEYVYLPLMNGVMLSTMFSVKDGAPARYELRVIKAEGDQIVFRELAFKPDLTPGAPVPERPLHSVDAKQADFTDMKVTRVGENDIKMALTFHPQGGAAQTRDIELHRVVKFVETKGKK